MEKTGSAMDERLADEARYLHRCLFRVSADELTIERYKAAHKKLFANEPPSLATSRVIERGLDAEAVEFALRRRRRGVDLTRKLAMLCYLAEVRKEHLGRFINQRNSRFGASTEIAGAMVCTLWKLAKGEYVIRRHGLL